MLLIDATNLNIGGGGALLGYLLQQLRGYDFHALVSRRTGLAASQQITLCDIGGPLGRQRQELLEKHIQLAGANRVLFFGNLPSRKKLPVKSYTYFHNAHLIAQLDCHCRYSLKDRLRYFLLRRAVTKFFKNTDDWIFQTSHVRDAFHEQYQGEAPSHVIPFFDQLELNKICKDQRTELKKDEYIYVSDDRPHKNHLRLLEAWQLLSTVFGCTPTLHLTVHESNQRLIQRIGRLNENGCRITNHGIVPRSKALQLTAQCSYVIFPSMLETIGLGLVEGVLLGAKAICTNDPGLREVIEPSLTFDPLRSQSIAEAVMLSQEKQLPNSKVVLTNQIQSLINLVAQK